MKGAIDFTKKNGHLLIRFSLPGAAVFVLFLMTSEVWAPHAECTAGEYEDFDARIECVMDWYRELEKAHFDPNYEIDGNAPGHPDDH